MKKILLYLIILLCLSSCMAKKDINHSIDLDIKKIAFVSDMHLQIDDSSDGVSYLNSVNTQLIQASFADIKASGVDLVILCGDNTNSGRTTQHDSLKEILAELKKDCQVLVVFGNHDISEVDKQHLPEVYGDYGYDIAFSKDEKSLSYSVLYDDLMVIILDTNNEDKWEISYPKFQKETLLWLENELNYGKDNNKKVICVGHYPIITRQKEDFLQQEEILNLFNKYDVPLYVCGHLHYHAVSEKADVKEVVISQTTSYPVFYELMEINEDKAILYPKKVDVEKWAKENKITNEKLLNFDEYLNKQYRKKCVDIISALCIDKQIEKEELDLAIDLFTKVMMYRNDGSLSLHIEEINNHEGYQVFQEISKGTIWNTWIPLVLSEACKDTMGFTINF